MTWDIVPHPLSLSAKRTTAARLIPNASTLLKHSSNTPKHSQTLPNSEPVVKQAYTTPGCRLTMIKAKHRGTQISDCFSFFFTMLLSIHFFAHFILAAPSGSSKSAVICQICIWSSDAKIAVMHQGDTFCGNIMNL